MQGLMRIGAGFFLLCCAILGNGCGPSPAEKALQDGNAFEQNGRLTEAMAEYKRAIELEPQNTNAYYNRALLYQKEGDAKAALADFDKIIAINPNFSEPYYGLGQIYDGQGQHDKAIAAYTKAIENNVNYRLAYYKRSMLYNSKGEYRKALDDAQKAKGMGLKIPDDFLRQLQSDAAKSQ